jgi:hypothetical protein
MEKAIAILSIWLGVGMSALAGEVVGFVAVMGMIATIFVVGRM